jgi:hypothetical protein
MMSKQDDYLRLPEPYLPKSYKGQGSLVYLILHSKAGRSTCFARSNRLTTGRVPRSRRLLGML